MIEFFNKAIFVLKKAIIYRQKNICKIYRKFGTYFYISSF